MRWMVALVSASLLSGCSLLVRDSPRGQSDSDAGADAADPRLARQWQRRDPATPLGARVGAAMAYYAPSQRVFLYGGANNDGVGFDAMHSWDGDDWVLECSPCGPGPRSFHGLVYDETRQRLVLYGGRGTDGLVRSDIWFFENGAWSEAGPVGVGPGPLASFFSAYDSERGHMVVFGGEDENGIFRNETHHFSDSWSGTQPAGGEPSPRLSFGVSTAAYDQGRGLFAVYGGWYGTGNEDYSDELWFWDGLSWTNPCDECTGQARSGNGLVYDPRREELVLFGGFATPPGDEIAGTWVLGKGGNEFIQRDLDFPKRDGMAAAYDPVRDVILVYGGNSFEGCSGNCDETLEYRTLADP